MLFYYIIQSVKIKKLWEKCRRIVELHQRLEIYQKAFLTNMTYQITLKRQIVLLGRRIEDIQAENNRIRGKHVREEILGRGNYMFKSTEASCCLCKASIGCLMCVEWQQREVVVRDGLGACSLTMKELYFHVSSLQDFTKNDLIRWAFRNKFVLHYSGCMECV